MNEIVKKVFEGYSIGNVSKLRVSDLIDKSVEIRETETLHIKEKISVTLAVAQEMAIDLLRPLEGEYEELFSKCLVGALIGCIKIDEHGVRFETGLLSIPGEEVLKCAATRQEFVDAVNEAWGHTEESHGLGQLSSCVRPSSSEEIPNSPLERVGFNIDLIAPKEFR